MLCIYLLLLLCCVMVVVLILKKSGVWSTTGAPAWTMVKRGGMGDFGAAWLQDHGLPAGSETLSLSL